MLSDLDSLMRAGGIDTILVPMHEAMHPSFRWLSRGAKVTRGYAIKRVDAEPLLVAYPMERDEAAASGLTTRLVHEFDHARIFREAANAIDGYAEFFTRVLRDAGSGPRIAFFGNLPVQLYLGVAEAMARSGWDVVKGSGEDLIQLARKRKEEWEIEKIRDVGRRTELVVDAVRERLRAATPELTLGDLKELVSSEIARHGMIEDHETILSQGRDAGVPHSRGDASARVVPSVPIILDIFPADKSSGYFFDLTRTFCIGAIPDALREIHGHVFEAFTRARNAMKPGTSAASYQLMTCDYFESHGFETTRRNPATLSGYVHSLGHGVGLDIHERPSFAATPSNRDLIEEGDIVTIEPGLYFPERAIGVRIEDTFVVRAGGVETLCRGSYELEP
ncbi:MAG TPA: Xaa-Pro peptidase family protein [Thermoanaerobaculia bacterium]|nr:Xaa-Pro peptidase family protein [Thermoanaerobaculia bacterium]